MYPVLTSFLDDKWSYDLLVYQPWIAAFLMQVIPMLTGMLYGFLMLDERDEQLISFYAVTPLTRRGYTVYRLGWPGLLCLVMTMLFFLLSNLQDWEPHHLITVLLLALEAPIFSLFLLSFASNKVEGLALSKAGGLVLCAPLFVWLLPQPWTWLGGFLPSYWATRTYVGEVDLLLAVSAVLGLLWHLAILVWLFRRSLARID